MPRSIPVIEKLFIRNLLSFGRSGVAFDFGRLNVLIGPNGSGKSNLLDVIKLLQAAPTDFASPMRGSGGIDEWMSKSAPVQAMANIALRIRIEGFDDSYLDYDISFRGSDGRTDIRSETLLTDKHLPINLRTSFRETPTSQSALSTAKARSFPDCDQVALYLESMALFTEWSLGRSAGPRIAQSPDQDASSLMPDAGNLALVLSQLQGSVTYDSIVTRLRDLKETYTGYFTRPLGGPLQLFLREEGLRNGVPASRLSDGTLRFLAHCAVLLHPTPPWFIAMEEPDIGMHPDLVRTIAEMLVEASQKSQVVITTHSADLLTALGSQVDNILVFSAGENGSEVKRFTPDQIGDWLKRYRLGDLWKEGDLGGNRF